MDGPCGNWYNQTFIESLNQPKPTPPSAITANRLASQENRRRPSRPALPRRQQVFQEQFPEEQLPQQLADLERFGQPKNGKSQRNLLTGIFSDTQFLIQQSVLFLVHNCSSSAQHLLLLL